MRFTSPHAGWLIRAVQWQVTLSLCVLLLALSCSTARADPADPQSWFDLSRWRNPRTWPFIPLPEVATDPNGGTTLGLLPVWLFTDAQQQISQIFAPDLTHNDALGIAGTLRYFSYPSEDTQWYAIVGGAEKIERDVDVLYSTGRTRQKWWSFDGHFRFERDPTERFFGLGNTSSDDDETNYTAKQMYAEIRFGLNITPRLQIGLEARPRYMRVRPGAYTSLPYTRMRFPTLKGLGANHELPTRLIVTYDSRDSVSIPTRGGALTVFGGGTDRHLLSSVSYTVFGADANHYFSLSDRFTLAGHLAARYMPVGKDVPFWALSRLGGDRSIVGAQQPLRGFGDGRFVDKNLFAANLELRTRVLRRDIFDTHVILELAPFIDLGRVSHHLDANPFSNLHPVGGLGFRGLAAPFVVGYVDVGYGSDGAAVFSGIDYPF